MLHVSVLGGQAITDDQGGAVLVRSSRAVALIAYLAVHAGTPHPRQQVAGLLWPDSSDPQALTNLRRELHHLRRVLGDEDALVVTSRDLSWADTETCKVDVRAFASERQAAVAAAAAGDDEAVLAHGTAAIEAYRGELLPGACDDWLLEDRSLLERQCVDLLDLVSAARARAADLAGAADAARHRVALRPLEEVGYRALMELQAGMGDRAAAVSTYHRCASVLERELGVAPDDATREAFRRLMDGGQPELRSPAGPDVGAPRPGQAIVPLVGRSAELRVLRDAWRDAVAGHCGLVLVRGPAGVGKTRLVSELSGLARQHGAVIASSQCFATQGRLALAPVADWLRSPAIRAATAAIDPAWRAEVGRLMPEGGPGGGTPDPGSAAMMNAWQRLRFFEGLARALLAVGRPLLLVLDNVQWCDQETLAIVTLCLRLAAEPGDQGDTRLLVVGTLRDDGRDADPELAEWSVSMRATGQLTELPLGPLEATEVALLAGSVAGQPFTVADAATLHAATGGFPLYVIEAVRGTAGTRATAGEPRGTPWPPDDLAAVLRKRLEQVTPVAQQVARLAAAVGTAFTLDLLIEAGDAAAEVVVAAVDELWRRRILRELGDGYDFSHDLLRETAYGQVSPPERWLLHNRVGRALELLHAGDTDAVAAQLAEQYARAGRASQAVTYYERAAAIAAGRFAHGAAVRLYRKALAIIKDMPEGRDKDSLEARVRKGMTPPLNAREGYASPALQRTLERSLELAERLGDADLVLTGLVGLWSSRFVQGRTADSYQVATRVLGLAGPGPDLRGQAHFAAGGSAISLGMPGEGLRHLELAAGLSADSPWLNVGTRCDVHSLAWSSHAHWLIANERAAQAASRQAIELARSISHPYSLAIALAYAAVLRQMSGDLPGLRAAVSELDELCRRYGFAYYREWALILDGWSPDGTESGIAAIERGIHNLQSAGAFARMPYWLCLLADRAARDGRASAARATLDAALSAGHARDDLWWLPEVMRMRAAYDDGQAAAARLRQAAGLARKHGSLALLRRCEDDLRAASAAR
jgi:DNA-binding SARP family transcriptional activator